MNTRKQLEELGYNEKLDEFLKEHEQNNIELGRIIAEHRERYTVKTVVAEYEAEITGNMRFSAVSREDFPAVGDWVVLTTYDQNFAVIHQVLPRFSVIKRQAAGQSAEVQIIAANIDYAFIVQAADRDFNINRLERYITICHSSGISPVIVLSKIDLISELRISEILAQLKIRIRDIPVIAVSNESQQGYESLKALIEKGKTYCMLGSSGAGKSTLINNLSGEHIMRTNAISLTTNKGRHTTSHREIIFLKNGGILIDNPGMREVGIADSSGGLEITFGQIIRYSQNCRFADCTHTNETGCAVIEAVEKGTIDRKSYENYLKMEREKAHFESSVSERRKKDKDFGKMIKNFKKTRNKNEY